jgi:hypothetical protein
VNLSWLFYINYKPQIKVFNSGNTKKFKNLTSEASIVLFHIYQIYKESCFLLISIFYKDKSIYFVACFSTFIKQTLFCT